MAIKLKRKIHPLQKKAKEGFRGYPVGTVAYYGPDNTKATKLVASVLRFENDQDPIMKKWFSEVMDIRQDAEIMDEIRDFFKENSTLSVVLLQKF